MKETIIDMEAKAIYLEDAEQFIDSLPEKAQQKIYYNIDMVCAGVRDDRIFKKLKDTDEIWEVKAKSAGIAYRVLSFWDTETETLIVATQGFVKKVQKTPRKEIEKAERIRKNYFKNK